MVSHGLVDSQLFRSFKTEAEVFCLCQSCFFAKRDLGHWVMTSETDSDEVPTKGWGRLKEDLCMVHTVPRVARIRAPPLQLCYLFTFSFCAVGMLAWLVCTLQFMEFNEVSISNAFVQLVPPWANSKSLCYEL